MVRIKKKARIDAETEQVIIQVIQNLAVDGIDVTWESIVKKLTSLGYGFSRQSLSAREPIKNAYRAAQLPEGDEALENRFKNHSKSVLIKQLQNVKSELDSAKAENERILLLYTFLLQHISEKYPLAMREVENLLAEKLALTIR